MGSKPQLEQFTLTVFPWGREDALAAQQRMCARGITVTTRLLAGACARWALNTLDQWDDYDASEQLAAANLVASTVMALRPASQAPDGYPTPTGGRLLLAKILQAARVNRKLVSRICQLEQATRGPMPPGTVWAPTLLDKTVPAHGWEELDKRLIGSLTMGPASSGLMMTATRIMSRGMGTGHKTDPAPVAARATLLCDTLQDTSLVTLGGVAARLGVDGLEGINEWLAGDVTGRSPAIVEAIRRTPISAPLDEAGLRKTLLIAARDMEATWVRRTREAAAGGQLAGAWIGEAISTATGLDYNGPIYSDILLSAASITLGWRENMHAHTLNPNPNLPLPVLDDTQHAGPVFTRGRWKGSIHPDGVIDLHTPTYTGMDTIRVGWAATATPTTPIQVGGDGPTHEDGYTILTTDSGQTVQVNDDDLKKAAFTLTRTPNGWQAHVTAPASRHTPGTQCKAVGAYLTNNGTLLCSTWGLESPMRDLFDYWQPTTTINTPAGQVTVSPYGHTKLEVKTPPQAASRRYLEVIHRTRTRLAGLHLPTLPTPIVARHQISAWVAATIKDAMSAQQALVDYIKATNPNHTHTIQLARYLENTWPMPTGATRKELAALWARRRTSIDQVLADASHHLLPPIDQAGKVTMREVAEYQRHLDLVTAAATAATTKTSHRKAPKDLAAGVRTRLGRARQEWARQLAHDTIELAKEQDATIIALTAPTRPDWKWRQFAAALNNQATTAGVTITNLTPPKHLTHPLTGKPLTVHVQATNALAALKNYGPGTPWWEQTRNQPTYSLTGQARAWLEDLSKAMHDTNNPQDWAVKASEATAIIPNQDGVHVAPEDAIYPLRDPLVPSPLDEPETMRLAGIQDSRQVIAALAAQTALTRNH